MHYDVILVYLSNHRGNISGYWDCLMQPFQLLWLFFEVPTCTMQLALAFDRLILVSWQLIMGLFLVSFERDPMIYSPLDAIPFESNKIHIKICLVAYYARVSAELDRSILPDY